jgi:RNA polymerase sigma factor (sigma-70 family)
MAETEVILLRRFARSRDAAAFAEITRRHAGLVYGAAWRILSDMDRAADVAQETFLQLTKDAGTISGSLPGWLHRVATHKAIDVRRREVTRRHREVQYAENQEREARDWKDISPYVDEGLRALDSELRDILIAHFLDGQTTRGIADAQGVSQATVSRRIEAGVNQLRAILRKRGIIVAVGAMVTFLGENSAQGAPAAVMAELGKMALVGGGSVAATGSVSSLLSDAVGTVAAAIKANAVAVAAVAVIGASSVVTYDYVSSSKKANAPAPVSIPAPVARPQGGRMGATVRTVAAVPPSATEQRVDQAAVASTRPNAESQDEQTATSMPSAGQVALTSDSGTSPSAERAFGGGGMGMGSFRMGGGGRVVVVDPNQPSSDGYNDYRKAARKPKTDPNDSNDPNDNDSNSTKP